MTHLLEILVEANEAGWITSTFDLGAISRELRRFSVAFDGGDEDPFENGDGEDHLMEMMGYGTPDNPLVNSPATDEAVPKDADSEQRNKTTVQVKSSRYEGFSLEHVREFVGNEAVKLYMDELMVRLNAAHSKGLLNDLYALGRVSGVIEAFAESMQAGNNDWAFGSDLKEPLHLKELDLELGVRHMLDE